VKIGRASEVLNITQRRTDQFQRLVSQNQVLIGLLQETLANFDSKRPNIVSIVIFEIYILK